MILLFLRKWNITGADVQKVIVPRIIVNVTLKVWAAESIVNVLIVKMVAQRKKTKREQTKNEEKPKEGFD